MSVFSLKIDIADNKFFNGETSPLFSQSQAKLARQFHQKIAGYRPTPLCALDDLANLFGVKKILVKDESKRFGLNAFKMLGGAYAIAQLLCEKYHLDIETLSFEHLKNAIGEKMTFATTTDGNHGRGVAWAAQQLGQNAVIYMPKGSAQERVDAILNLGAECIVTDMNYDDTVRLTMQHAQQHGWEVVQDTAWEGYTKIPTWIMQGYATLADEAVVDHNGETRLTDVFMIGDVQRGPSSIVAAVGTARRATDAILSRENIRSHQNDKYWNNVNPAEIYQRKGDISITLVNSDDRDAFVAQEAARCLECNYVCSKCVDVCPNRANVSIAVPGFQNRFQTLHLDAYCNECGNCAQFCPWNGKPYKDKITVFSLSQDFDNSSNPGFLVEDCRVRVRLNNQSWVLNIDSEGQFNNVPPELNDMCRIISHVHQHHHYLLGRVEV